MSFKAKLNRMRVHLSIEKPNLPAAPDVVQIDIPHYKKWTDLQAKPFFLQDEYVIVREVRYPLTHRHGLYNFAQLHEVIRAWEESGIHHPLSSARKTAEELLFFDTETTGLHGGAGNAVFLLGHARVEADCVVVKQHFLAAPHAEVALYQSFLQEVTAVSHLVTYNGKAFDWPQVMTRHTLIRDQVPRLPSFGHYDLLHGARRLWKNHLESCRLSLIEQEKLGVTRKSDVPGHLAPILYFDYLNDKDPDTIAGVLRHNELDVLSLITLYIHISKLLLVHEHELLTQEERFEIARWYEALGEDGQAAWHYRTVAESGHSLGGKARMALGHLYKRQRKWKQALDIWEGLINEALYVPEEVYVEAAKLCEHQLKDYEKALHYTLQAYDIWKKKGSLLRRKSKAEQEAYCRRIERLEQKISRAK